MADIIIKRFVSTEPIYGAFSIPGMEPTWWVQVECIDRNEYPDDVDVVGYLYSPETGILLAKCHVETNDEGETVGYRNIYLMYEPDDVKFIDNKLH